MCYSNKTWDECEKGKTPVECLHEHDDVCIKMKYIENDDTEKGFKQAFVKMCGRATLCTNKECRYKYKTCHIDCCHNDLCNGATGRPHATSTLLAIVLGVLLCLLQLRCIFWTWRMVHHLSISVTRQLSGPNSWIRVKLRLPSSFSASSISGWLEPIRFKKRLVRIATGLDPTEWH